MYKDPTQFRERFKKWKETGEYKLPSYKDGKYGKLPGYYLGTEERTVDGGILPEVVVTPDPELRTKLIASLGGNEKFYKGLVNDIWRYKNLHEAYNTTWYRKGHGSADPGTKYPANYEIERLADIAKSARKPAVVLSTRKDNSYYDSKKDWYRAHTNTVDVDATNLHMFLGDPDVFEGNKSKQYPYLDPYLAELSHFIQTHGGKFDWKVKNIKKRQSEPQDNDTHENLGFGNYENGYEDPGNSEYQAHSIIEPTILNYMRLGNAFDVNQFYNSIYHDIEAAENSAKDLRYKGTGVARGRKPKSNLSNSWKVLKDNVKYWLKDTFVLPKIYSNILEGK